MTGDIRGVCIGDEKENVRESSVYPPLTRLDRRLYDIRRYSKGD